MKRLEYMNNILMMTLEYNNIKNAKVINSTFAIFENI